MSTPATTADSAAGRRARSRRLALLLALVALAFYAAFIVASYLRGHA